MDRSIQIRKFSGFDRKDLVRCLEGLCDYLIPLDPIKRIRRLPPWGTSYTRSLLQKIKRNNGVIYLAQCDGKTIGIIAGIILKQNKLDLLEFAPTKFGRVLELFVEEKLRGKHVGQLLIEKMEDYFRSAKCDFVRIEVFEPNVNARSFYQRLGYNDRVIDLIKKV